MKMIVQISDPWVQDGAGVSQRRRLLSDPGLFARRLADVMEDIALLEELIGSQREAAPVGEVIRHLDRWTAFVVSRVRVGVPFVMKFSQTLPLDDKSFSDYPWYSQYRRLWR